MLAAARRMTCHERTRISQEPRIAVVATEPKDPLAVACRDALPGRDVVTADEAMSARLPV